MEIEIYRIRETEDGNSRVLSMMIDHSKLLGGIFSEWYHHIAFMSDEQIKSNILESISLAEETLIWKKNGALKKKINSIRDYISKNVFNRRNLMMIVTNSILSAEGLSNIKR